MQDNITGGPNRAGKTGADALQKIMAVMLRHEIAALPRNFELVYEALSGGNPDLSHELATLGAKPSQHALDQLGLKHRLPGHCGATAERLQTEALSALSSIKAKLALGLSQKRSFARSVETAATSIRAEVDVGIEQLLGELDLLASLAREMVQAETLLAHEVAEGLDTLETADRAMQAAKAMTLRDRLTGLPNRAAFLQKLEETHARSTAAHTSALVLIEICDLAQLHHQYGDEAAAKLVKGLARIFRKAIKKHDYIARIDADTFALVFDDIDASDAHIIAERLFTTAENNRVFASETGSELGGLPLALGHVMAQEAADPLHWLSLAKTATQLARHNPRQPIIGHKPGQRQVA
ncbi:diguanylate cyclase [Rhizobium sp. Root274]|uniref:GGDEF domain-containing protein n=1 Tax=unclassified Rhizobium TaxID=2613769 RepID=UPI000712A5DA|nr:MULTISPECIES: GGDEF domain-containing protein [unclassified Rhizobium]KQW30984.1 diguanylate cyclase [Rhizobium sp. Root1240]KRD32530.1 diguanylate cyclase [Rhizobium sp. Root274]